MIEVKPIAQEHISSVATLLRQYWKERGLMYTQKWTEQYLTQGHTTELKKEQTFTIKNKGKIIGAMSAIIWEGNVAELRDAVIKKEHRGQGYGKKLLEHVLEWCKRNNVRKVFALVMQDHRKMLEQEGFVLEGFLKHHFKQNEHLIIMSRFPEKKVESQVNLKAKFADLEHTETIERETASRLRGLSTKS